MKTIFAVALVSVLAGADGPSPKVASGQGTANPAALPREARVERFEITDTNIVRALAELSRSLAGGLHLGVEEIIKENYSDPDDQGVRFSMRVENKTVGEILDALCGLDSRYTWSMDGSSINVYPRATISDGAYLLNLQIEQITIVEAADPYAVLGPLSRQHPEQQIGYAHLGGDPRYAGPWSVTFEHLTVRQLINRVAEHMGPQTSWTWHGIKTERMFGFFKGGYHVQSQ
jgi:hypothetical protein